MPCIMALKGDNLVQGTLEHNTPASIINGSEIFD